MIDEKIIREFEASGFWNHMQFKAKKIENGEAIISLKLNDFLQNTQKLMHGGAMMSLADTAMGIALKSTGIQTVATIQLEMKFLKKVEGGCVEAYATILHTSPKTSVVTCSIYNERDELVALSTATFKI